ncbi:MAG: ABC transporter ATP-binding protein [Bdellovibrionota bacterium]
MIEVKDVFFNIGATRILNGVSMHVKTAETVGIIGPNGSGKTTLFNCLSGFNIPQKGKILLNGKDITHERPFNRAKNGMGRVFQNPGIFREMTVHENVLTALESRSQSAAIYWPWSKKTREHNTEAQEYIEMVGLGKKANDKAGSLSGGQMRLLEIVRSLAFGAEVFLLDEPTAGVSPKMKEDVAKLIRNLQEMNKTVLIIEHDINFIEKFCQRVVVLDVGQVVLDDSPDNLRNNEKLQEIYFGTGEH